MEHALKKDFEYLREYDFSDRQLEGLAHWASQEKAKIEHKMVTKGYLDLQVENIKKSLVIQTMGVVLSGMVLLGWFINYLDNKTRLYVEAQFNAQDRHFNARFDAQDKQFNTRFDAQDKRFDKIESDLKDIKNFIFSRASVAGGVTQPPSSPPIK